MGKTYRFSPEDEVFGFQDHKIPRRDIRRVQRIVARQALQSLPQLRVYQPPEQAISSDWIPSGYDLDQRQEYLRQTRLDLLQTLGEQLLSESLPSTL